MNTQQSRLGVEHYLAGMREALADLPAAEVGEIMEDVEAHVAEIAAELGEDETLEQRLGTPEAYAQELRTAAGYPARTEVMAKPKVIKKLTKARLAAWGLAGATAFTLLAGTAVLREAAILLVPAAVLAISLALVHEHGPRQSEIMALPETRKLKEWLNQPADTPAGRAINYVQSLQPAWWLLRTALLGLAAVLLTTRDLLGFLAVAALAVVSFYASPKSKTDRRWLWITLPASALAIATTLQMVDYAADSVRYGGLSGRSYPTTYNPPPMQYENIYPYDSNGKLLEGVLLFDEDGNAINAPTYGARSCPGDEPVVIPNNRYPRPKIDYVDGKCVTVPPSAATPSTSVTPSGSTSPSGSVAPSGPPSSGSVAPSVTTTPSPSK